MTIYDNTTNGENGVEVNAGKILRLDQDILELEDVNIEGRVPRKTNIDASGDRVEIEHCGARRASYKELGEFNGDIKADRRGELMRAVGGGNGECVEVRGSPDKLATGPGEDMGGYNRVDMEKNYE